MFTAWLCVRFVGRVVSATISSDSKKVLLSIQGFFSWLLAKLADLLSKICECAVKSSQNVIDALFISYSDRLKFLWRKGWQGSCLIYLWQQQKFLCRRCSGARARFCRSRGSLDAPYTARCVHCWSASLFVKVNLDRVWQDDSSTGDDRHGGVFALMLLNLNHWKHCEFGWSGVHFVLFDVFNWS